MARPVSPLPGRLSTLPRAGAALVLAVVALLSAAPSASAETAYRYWAYFTAEQGSWTAATTGPADVTPTEGSVQAMRFAVHGSEARAPRTTPDFEAVCGDVAAPAEGARVAVLVDPGTAEDAPEGGTGPGTPTATCVLAAPGDTARDVFEAVAEVRDSDGLICALAGYPATGCGDPAPASAVGTDSEVQFEVRPPVGFSEVPPSAAPSGDPADGTDPADDGASPGLITLGVVVAALLLAAVAALLGRRRRGRP
ncbi:hypothetical protein GC722_04510 [Auraticoccus sp. F435]|uniref:LPXTG cell wall anchor domain-containing protein n=1 Tax=Auraticoccus cholistanensis TaxID=2656650 RepID=A0A6A9UUP1_9ACTN|nr:SCO2322 family protein [Auraticoccus cholistanensis]MVA75294.1 hypothetical protein [Auraticoccus cholistanensis]